uniref:KIB1-4 beta-propeller domain-containing protein n=1 Tax=Arundo donax TaxID=35708 RepID=A0A0A9HHM1_ARUDO
MMIHGEDEEITFCRKGKGLCQAKLNDPILDMVFFKGKLYALTQGEGLFVLIIEENKDSRPAVSTVKQMIADSHYPSFPILDIWGSPIVEAQYLRHYLVVSRGRLLMVRRWLDDPREVNAGDGDRTLSFEVFMVNNELVGWMEHERTV